MAKRWYVIHTYSGYENKVKADLEHRIETMGVSDSVVDIQIPTEEVTEVKDGGQRSTKESKVFPGYVLIKMVMTDESWYVVKNVRGVTGFVGSANKPTPLTEDEVAQLGVEKREIVVNYKVGDSVKVCDGPLTSFMGTVEALDVDKNKVRVVVSMFGRETPVELELDQVEPVNS